MRTEAASLMMCFKAREDASKATASLAVAALEMGLTARGSANLAVSGGTTPEQTFHFLSEQELDWSSINITLVDERFVPPDHEASNEGLLRRTLLKNRASAATFLPMWHDTTDPAKAARRAANAYAEALPPDFALLGMGEDGHVASWFPGAEGLADAFRYTSPSVTSVEASAASGTSSRLTLTRRPVVMARHAILLIFGEKKRDVFATSLTRPEEERPVRALVEGLGDRLTVVWAP